MQKLHAVTAERHVIILQKGVVLAFQRIHMLTVVTYKQYDAPITIPHEVKMFLLSSFTDDGVINWNFMFEKPRFQTWIRKIVGCGDTWYPVCVGALQSHLWNLKMAFDRQRVGCIDAEILHWYIICAMTRLTWILLHVGVMLNI